MMRKRNNYIISIDVGTSYIKAGLYDSMGNCRRILNQKVPHLYTENGAFEQKGDDFVRLLFKILKNLDISSDLIKKDIEAIAFTGQMAGVIGIDKNWDASTIWSGTMDNRQNLMMADVIDADMVLKLSGTNFPFMAKKIKWFEKEHKVLYKNTSKFIGLSSYVIGKIADLKSKDAFLESTYLTWTGIADLKNRKWSQELCSMFQIDGDKLPFIVDATEIVGRLSKSAASSCGLPEGIPIIAGAGDKITGCIGSGAVQPGMLVEECASIAAMSFCNDEYKPDIKHKTLETIPSAIPGQYYYLYFISGSGLSMDWFVDNFAGEEKKIAQSKNSTIFKYLDKKAEKIPAGSDHLLCIGHLSGRALPFQPDVRGAWIGHSFLHNKIHFYRSMLESYAYEYKHCLDILKEEFQNLKFSDVRVIGGGANSDLWNEIKADVLGLNYERLEREDLSLLGTAIIAGSGTGIFDDIEKTAKNFAKVKKTIKYNKKQKEKYLKMSSIYLKFIKNNMEIFSELNKGRNNNEA